MPTYEYQCDQCHATFEVRQRITEDPLTRCEACGGAVRRLISPAPFILKGEGWYVTDYPSESRKKAQQAEKGSDKSTGDKSADKPAASAEKSSTATTNTTASTAPSKDGGSSSPA